MEKKITLDEFWESNEIQAIHCNTKEKAKELLKAFDKMGKAWGNRESYPDNTEWGEYEKYTCYGNDRTYGDTDDYDKIYEFEDVDLGAYAEDKTMIDLFQEMKSFTDEFFEKAKAMLGVKEEQKEETEETPKEKTWKFTEKEKAFLKVIDEKFKYITRDSDGELWVFKDCPYKDNGAEVWIDDYCECIEIQQYDELFGLDFDNIQWEDETPCEFRKYIGEDDE